jgi:hypothetical protein
MSEYGALAERYLRGYMNTVRGRSLSQYCPVMKPGPCICAVGMLCNSNDYERMVSVSVCVYVCV